MDDPSASQPSKARKAECASCGGPRNCDIRGEYSDPFDDGYETVWRILQCRGCGSVFVQTVSSNPENVDSEPNELGETIWFCITIEKYWPALTKRKKPEWIREYGVLDAEEVGALAIRGELEGNGEPLIGDARVAAGRRGLTHAGVGVGLDADPVFFGEPGLAARGTSGGGEGTEGERGQQRKGQFYGVHRGDHSRGWEA